LDVPEGQFIHVCFGGGGWCAVRADYELVCGRTTTTAQALRRPSALAGTLRAITRKIAIPPRRP